MTRAAVLASLCLLAAPAAAQQVDGGAPAPLSTLDGPPPASSGSPDLEALKRDLLEQARREADERVAKAKEEMRNEVRAELATQSANRSWEEEWQEQKKKLDLIEVDGYLRVRPTLLYNMDLGVGQDPSGAFLYPRTHIDPNITDITAAQTLAWADMRARFEPTLNISEDIRLKAQVDLLNNLILGSTPEVDGTYPLDLLSMNQLTPANAVLVRRAWGEVNTPVGLLSFGRMGDHWGMGIFHNDGNCLDCDYGNSIDRIMFTARIAGFYLVPMVDFVAKGLTTYAAGNSSVIGHVTDASQEDDVNGPFAGPAVSAIVAKRDTDKEAQHKIDNGEYVFNYGLYYSFRHQTYSTAASPSTGVNPPAVSTADQVPASILRNGFVHEPDLWAKFMNKRLKLEAELSGVFGSVNNGATTVGTNTPQAISIIQFGGAARGEYKFLDGALTISAEYGFASGDPAPGLGNQNAWGSTPTQAGYINGSQFNCAMNPCSDASVSNFVFARDYRIDEILWREILGGVTDAMYVKPGARYQIAEGFDVFLHIVYSRTIFASSVPGNDNNLGVEFDPGVSYTSDDGFVASLRYGGLIPLAGLSSVPVSAGTTAAGQPIIAHNKLSPSVAHALRLNLAVKF